MVQLMPLHPETPSPLASFKSRVVSPFWYQLTYAVLEKRPLNGRSSSSSTDTKQHAKSIQGHVMKPLRLAVKRGGKT